MNRTKTLFVGGAMVGTIAAICVLIWDFAPRGEYKSPVPESKYGSFLAANHAIYVNDFNAAQRFSEQLSDVDVGVVTNVRLVSEFLSGKLPAGAAELSNDKSPVAMMVHDAYLAQGGKWSDLYERHKTDTSSIAMPLRVWSSVAAGKSADVLKFIDQAETTDVFKNFVRGQIYAEQGDAAKAADAFAQVPNSFLNLNDYLYLVAFYNHNKMTDAAAKLRAEFTGAPGGMFMLGMKIAPKWADYSGARNALAFGFIQSVSHTQVMMYSDLSLLMLRFAEIVRENDDASHDALNYYLGQYFFNNGGDYKRFFEQIKSDSPFYPFANMKMVEKTGKVRELERAARSNPLFVSATSALVAKRIAHGERRAALRAINRALDADKITDMGRAYFLRMRAETYLAFGDYDDAGADVLAAVKLAPMDAGLMMTQSKIWSLDKSDVQTAYDYAMSLVQKNPTEIGAWDVLGLAIWAGEGARAALDTVEKVGAVAQSHSALFLHMGDMYVEIGDVRRAIQSYERAIDLSDDGMVVVPDIEKKLKELK